MNLHSRKYSCLEIVRKQQGRCREKKNGGDTYGHEELTDVADLKNTCLRNRVERHLNTSQLARHKELCDFKSKLCTRVSGVGADHAEAVQSERDLRVAVLCPVFEECLQRFGRHHAIPPMRPAWEFMIDTISANFIDQLTH
jgi:hypothetical protein